MKNARTLAIAGRHARGPRRPARAADRQQEVGRRGGPRADPEGRLRHVRRHVDERGRQPRRPADRLRSAGRHLHDARRRHRRRRRPTRITSGPAFDMQPRFSPDGKRIAFSQRSRRPLEHLDDGRRRGRTRSRCRGRSAGSSTARRGRADGSYIFARRHFVAQRSLGAGEIWMFHAAGSDGLQVTEKNGFQKDAGEPAVSPDGRYLYYSKDVTPGQNFEYNKDPNGTIYAIVRRDLTTGRERTVVSVQGGSVTPRVSPDGKSLAYVRRVRLAEQPVRPRSRDRRAIARSSIISTRICRKPGRFTALYPQYAWTPGRQGIVIWGEGKIWRVDVAAGKGDARAVHRARRADGERGGALRAEGPHAGVPGQGAAQRGGLARRQARHLQRARAPLRQGSPGRPAEARDQRRRLRVRAEVVGRRAVDRPHDVDRRGLRPRARRPSRRHGRPRRRHEARPLHRAGVLAGRQVDRVPERGHGRHPRARCMAATPASTSSRRTDRPRRGSCAKAGPSRRSTPRASACSSTTPARGRPCSSASASAIRTRRCRAATTSSTSSPRTRPRSCRRPTASGWRSRSAGTRSSRRSRTPAVRST